MQAHNDLPPEPMSTENTTEARDASVESMPLLADWAGALTEILRECHRCPSDSVVDIANDAFCSFKIPFEVEWTDDDSDPVTIIYTSPANSQEIAHANTLNL